MRKKNEILPDLQEKFEAALHRGQLLELNSASDWLGELVDELGLDA